MHDKYNEIIISITISHEAAEQNNSANIPGLKKRKKADNLEEAILKSIKSLEERRSTQVHEEELFGKQIASMVA